MIKVKTGGPESIVTYDRRIGYTFSSVSLDDDGLYECFGTRGSTISKADFHLLVSRKIFCSTLDLLKKHDNS